ncbi:thioredoxin 1 [Fusarium austroafricanum]|uniref:Thioredoxin 1 n=1 Tax=Fusarium austroafricanum TaxID=2364996 RepID=A0A8H4JNE9_9HYPO|nr:thioredoxin 1 [Fusarium austroafricanum]
MVHYITSKAEFDKLLASTTYVMVDFYADWCGPCRNIEPFYKDFATKYSVDGILAFAKVNVDHVQEVAQEYKVAAMPTFIFFKNGNRVRVHGDLDIKGADPMRLKNAADKLGGLAQKRVAEAAARASGTSGSLHQGSARGDGIACMA